MKVVITDYEYKNIDTERKLIEGAGFELYDYQLKNQKSSYRSQKMPMLSLPSILQSHPPSSNVWSIAS